MTLTLTLTPLTYSVAAFLFGWFCMATDREGGYLGIGLRSLLGLALWLSIPFVWLGAWLS